MRKWKSLLFTILVVALLWGSSMNVFAAGNRDWKWPVPASNSLSSCYLDGRSHYALDIVAGQGTAVYASYPGTVIATSTACTHNYGKSSSCGCNGGMGNYVYVSHTYNGVSYVSRYIHLTGVNVSVGSSVTKDTVIGTVGSTGYSTGFHLDFRIYQGSSTSHSTSACVDPFKDQFLEMPSGLNANGATTFCCYTYVDEVKALYATQTGPVSFDTTGVADITQNNGVISTWVSNSGTISEIGFYIGMSDYYQNKVVMSTGSIGWTRFHLQYDLSQCYGELSPGTTYKYKFYTISDGVEHCSEQKEFTTGGISKISYDTYGITNITDLNVQVSAWFSNSQGYTMSSIGFYAGEDINSLQKYEVKSNYAWTRHHQVYQLEDYFGTLKADTDYVARFYVTIDNTNYYSDFLYIHTAGPKVTYDTYDIANITEDNAQISAWFSNSQGYTMSSIGFYAGEDINSLQKYEVKSNYAWTRHHQIYQMEEYLGKLKAGTDYVARFYVTIDNVDYYSEYLYLTTEGHTHDYESFLLEAAGCETEGKMEYRCGCGDAYIESIGATGHAYGDWTTVKEPTSSTEGLKERTCEVCGDIQQETIEKTSAQTNPFTDVKESDYYYEPVLWAVNNGITSGLTATTFAPEAGCTRGQVVTFLWRAAGKPSPASAECSFTDVPVNEYYRTAVLWAVENGITSGLTETTFAPESECTRGQIVTFLWRAAGQPVPSATTCEFKDVASNAYYRNAVLWAVEKGITSGLTSDKFGSENVCTRGQVVTFLYRSSK